MDIMLWGYETIFTIALSILGFIIVIWAQWYISHSYGKYKRISNKKGLSGFEVARQILDQNDLSDIHIVETKGELSDHYDPSHRVVRLSHDIFHGTSVAAMAVAAHEVGHAIQDKTGYVFMNIRSFLVPIVNLVSYLGYFVSIIALFFGAIGYLKVGLVIILATILFQLITLPVEFNASNRARKQIEMLHLADQNDQDGVKKMLTAAAMTYVASLVSSLLNLLRMVLMILANSDRE